VGRGDPVSGGSHALRSSTRRRIVGALAATTLAPFARRSEAAIGCASADAARGEPAGFARLALQGQPLVLRAGVLEAAGATPYTLGYACEHRGVRFRSPTLVVERGERVRIDLVNELREPTIVHWHGIANDMANDGGGHVLADPGSRYAYDFIVRERSGLYWYHPHPHGHVAGQLHDGLFGLIEVNDDDERALRKAMDFRPGESEMALLLQDRRDGSYAPGADDRHHGFLGDVATVNGCASPVHEVATRAYRLRIANVSNARNYRLGFRVRGGDAWPFDLIGTDGGLLPRPLRCEECFVSAAERIDVVLDLRDAKPGDEIVLETRAFDPMHTERPETPGAPTPPETNAGHSAHDARARPGRAAAQAAWPEGAARDLATFRVRHRIDYRASLPERLAALPPIDVSGAKQRAFRLGFNKGRWRINDRVFASGEVAVEVLRDTTETWLLRNYHTSMPHAMHLHGFHFRVIERETSPDFIARMAQGDNGRLATDFGAKDTVLVWPGESVRLAVRFAMPFAGPQTYMFHCHNVEHEDGGMMVGIRVS
jgi:suppressor of ftsI/bilirubin oxidase